MVAGKERRAVDVVSQAVPRPMECGVGNLASQARPTTIMANKFRLQREKMWRRNPHCHYCGVKTILPSADGKSPRVMNEATIDHLRPRHHPGRLEPCSGEIRRVLACWECNNKRDQWESALLPKSWFYAHGGSLPAEMKPLEELRRIEQTLLLNPPRSRKRKGRHEKNLREIRAMIARREGDEEKESTMKQGYAPLEAEANRTQEAREGCA